MHAPPRHPSFEERFDPAVRILPPDRSWAVRFEREAARLRAALGAVADRVEHVGSTAVSGLASKPIVDLQVSVDALQPFERYAGPLARLGYVFLPAAAASGDEDARLFAKPPQHPRSFHLHVCRAGSAHEERHLAVRDYLRAHPDEADAYAALKRGLVARRPLDRLAYMHGKASYVVELEQRALYWARERTRRPS